MPDRIIVRVNGSSVEVAEGSTAAIAAMVAGATCRISVTGRPRTPFCGMGICFECRMTINGAPHTRSCQVVVEPGMDIRTDE
jgi:sarcosine oxidase subunit alpha